MKTVRAALREADPVDGEFGIATDDVERMRRALLACEGQVRPRAWPKYLAAAAALVVLVSLGSWLGAQRVRPGSAQRAPGGRDQLAGPVVADRARRQVQFATPGGTRIIWVFDSSFDVR